MSRDAIALPQPGWTMRPWREGDEVALQAAADDERILRWMSDTWPSPYTLADAQWWVGEGSRNGRNWAICLDDLPQGGCGLMPQSGFQRCNAEVGWWLAPPHWGRGVATAAAVEVLKQVFAAPDITRAFAAIHAGNAPSMRVAEKVGMRLESVQPHSALKHGQVITRHLYACYR